ncbi:DUF4118 domain-containing protein [Bradyrhizobium sp. ISRA435]|nr:DUF4118 domain-containing protein [Bradyrhizobium sp. ISRA435]
MRKGNDYILKLRPWSLSTFVVALLAVAFAAAMQEVFATFGLQLYFATFVPAILIAGLLGGATRRGLCHHHHRSNRVVGVHPPCFEFAWPTAAEYDSISTFLLSSALLVCFSQLYREALVILRK